VDDLLAGRYPLAPVMQLGVLIHLGTWLGRLGAGQDERAARLDARIVELQAGARAAAGLADDVPEVVRTATPAWRGRPAAREPARTLIYRRRADGGVIGFAVDAPMLEAVAGPDAGASVASRARPL